MEAHRIVLKRARLLAPALAALFVFSAPVTAQASGTGSPSSGVQTVPATAVAMTLDCAGMSPRAKAYAGAHGYCSSSGGGVTPYSTTVGNCGSSWLTIWNEGSGYAEFSYGFQSTLGNVVYRSLGVNWTNWSTGGTAVISDSSWMNSSYYNRSKIEWTRPGFVTGSMTGWVLLWWGGTCSIIPPSDYVTVT